MTTHWTRTVGDLIRGLADRIDPIKPTITLPQIGDRMTVTVLNKGDTWTVHGEVVLASVDPDPRTINYMTLREVREW